MGDMLKSNSSVADNHVDKRKVSVATDPESHPLSLAHGKWSPTIHKFLHSWLMHLKSVPETDSMVAVFDFDNTCIYRDVGKAVFRYQLSKLRFRLSPVQLEKLFPENIDCIGGKSFLQVKNRIVSLYQNLWPYLQSNHHTLVLQEAAHLEFEALFFWYCTEISKNQGANPRHSLSFLAKLLAGYSTEEVENITCKALMSVLYEPIVTTKRTVQCCESLGKIEVCHAGGLRVHDEIFDLMKQLRSVGVRCCIVSASHEWIVKTTALFFELPVQWDDIYGIRLKLSEENIFTTDPVEEYPVTYREGKVQVVNSHIEALPILVAGDAVTDFELLTIPMATARLIINHNKSGLISTLYNDPRFLLQGLDKETGCFRPHRDTLERKQQKKDHKPESGIPLSNAA